MSGDVREFWNMISNHHVCMLATNDGADLRSRPMAPLIDRESGEIRFLTRASSHKSEEISNDARVNLAFMADHDEGFISVNGTARLSQDRDLIRSLWSPVAQAWLPEGPDGSDVALIRVRPLKAEIWDLKRQQVANYWDMARSGRAGDGNGHHEVRL